MSKVEVISILGIVVLLVAITYSAFDSNTDEVLLDSNTSLIKSTELLQEEKRPFNATQLSAVTASESLLPSHVDKSEMLKEEHNQILSSNDSAEDDIGGRYDDYAESPESMLFQQNEQENIGFVDPDAVAPEKSIPTYPVNEDDDIEPR